METLSSKYINVNGSLLDLSVPCVMGILNITPDSFYAGSRMQTEAEITARAQQILDEGAGIIDIGAYSSRPNAENVCLLYTSSGMVELLQEYCTTYRGGDWLDFAANTTGALIASLIGYFVLRPRMAKKQ